MSDPAKILVVDDTANNVKLLKDLLTMRGYADSQSVTLTRTGTASASALRSTA